MSQETLQSGNGTATITPPLPATPAVSNNGTPQSVAWETYPETLPSFDDILYDASRLHQDLNEQSQTLFSDLVNLKVTDVDGALPGVERLYSSLTSG